MSEPQGVSTAGTGSGDAPLDEPAGAPERRAILGSGGLLRAAVIGTGFVGPHHVDAIRRAGYAEVVALAGSHPGRTEARARQLGVPRASVDVPELLSDASLDVVHVCTPNNTHLALARAALEAGKHVVVEKPLGLTSGETEELVTLARRMRLHAAVAFTYRGYPMIRRARQLLRDGELGEVRLVHGSYLQDWLLEPSDYNWRVEEAAGGPSRAVADIGSHWFDTTEFVSGLHVEAVLADLATFVPARQRPAVAGAAFQAGGGAAETVPVSSEDAATILVRFAGGARGACIVSQVSPGRKNAFHLEISGARRSIHWEQENPNHLWVGARGDGSAILPREPSPEPTGTPSLPPGHPEGWGEALRDLLRPFYRAVADGLPPPDSGDEPPYPTFADGARAVAFVEAVLASARDGRWTPLVPAGA